LCDVQCDVYRRLVMARMKRKQIYIEPEQDRRLRVLARRRGKTESQLIREGIDQVLNASFLRTLDHEAWVEQREFIDSLIRQGPVKGRRTWTREELHER
jgi:predicted transcriptional regulator